MTNDALRGCLVGGAIGDGLGSAYEQQRDVSFVDFDIPWQITDDTQLTIATCESIADTGAVSPESIAAHFLRWYNSGRLTGLGASTLKSLRDLQMGAHWWLAGRSGEYAAGNGAAMRIAPLAFFLSPADDSDRAVIRDVCSITHKNDEAYVGGLAVIYALRAVLEGRWPGDLSLLTLITPLLPDTLVRDGLLLLQDRTELTVLEAAALVGCSGYAAQSVPFALFAAQQSQAYSFAEILEQIIRCGGDTDTNASIAGQVMGAYLGYSGLPVDLVERFRQIPESDATLALADRLAKRL